MPFSNIDKPSKYFNTVTYSGNGVNPTSITSVGFKPDLLWIKCRSNIVSNLLFDAVRGVSKRLISNSTATETTETQIASFDTNGWTMDADTANNGSGRTYVAWNWLASNTAGSSNTSGTISSTVSANTTSGFSIVTFTYSSGSPTVGHGLGVAPAIVIVKNRTSDVNNWLTYHKSMGATKAVYLNSTSAEVTSSVFFNNTAPTSSVFTVSSNLYAADHVAYCFAEVKGFSKFGSYTGNGSTDGTFIYTGFKPAFVLIKQSSGAGEFWTLSDNKRVANYNVTDARLFPNSSNAESSNGAGNIDFLSNGFKIRNSDAPMNTSSATYIYMAFAENPFVSSKGIPTTAR